MSRTYRNLPGIDPETNKRRRCLRKPSQTLWYGRLADRCNDEVTNGEALSKLNRIGCQTRHRPNYYDDTVIAAFEELTQDLQHVA